MAQIRGYGKNLVISRIAFATLLFAMGAYTSISFFIDNWEGNRCWQDGSSDYVRLPFGAALSGAWQALLADAVKTPSTFMLEVLMLTAFLWVAVSVLIGSSRVIKVVAFFLTALPFSFNIHDQIRWGIIPYCDGRGDAPMAFFVMQLLIILPAGLFCAWPRACAEFEARALR